jgi:cation:H+ antiporter
MLTALAAIVIGFILLVWSADRFVAGASATATHLGIAPLIVGVVIVGIGTSAPEMLVSIMAAAQGNANIAIGNALGSNITNVGLILGATAMLYPLSVQSGIIRRELPILAFIMMVSLILMIDGVLSRLDGTILISGFVALLAWSFYQAKTQKGDALEAEFEAELKTDMTLKAAIAWLIAGITILVLSSKILVWGAVFIAEAMGISDLIIGLTIIAIGTSLPELAATIAAARKAQYDIAVGNVVGSNMFNLVGVLAFPGLLAPGAFDQSVMLRDFPVMIALAVLLILFASNFTLRSAGTIGRVKGFVLLLAYFSYMGLLYVQASS